jgi:hypothetical protein
MLTNPNLLMQSQMQLVACQEGNKGSPVEFELLELATDSRPPLLCSHPHARSARSALLARLRLLAAPAAGSQ